MARLGEIADVNWGDTTVTKASYVASGYRAYSASGPDGYLPYADFNRAGVIVSAIGAACGKTWLARGRWSCIKNTIRFWSIDPGVDTEFLYWRLRDPALWPKRGSAQPFISQGDARRLVVSYPPIAEQRRIADVLGALDDKVDLNRQTSETLEAMARAFFKSWFVHFDPIRARAGGPKSRLPARVLDLFPVRLEPSPWGPVPEGWDVVELQEAFAVKDGKPLPVRVRGMRHEFPVYGANGVIAHFNHCTVDSACIILGKIGSSGTLHRSSGPCWVSNNAFAVRPGRASSLEYAWHTLRSIDFAQFVGGSAHPYMPLKTFGHHPVLLPSPSVLAEFEERAGLLYRCLEARQEESRVLAELRDALLPRLISGELCVTDAERVAVEAGT